MDIRDDLKKKIVIKFCFAILFFASIVIAQTPPEQLKIEAEKFMTDGRYGDAIDLLNRYISALPQTPEGYNLRGICYENRAQYEMSVYDFRSALKLEPANFHYKQNLERSTEVWQSQLYNNILGYNREIALNPDKALNYLEIGKCYKNLGNWGEAEIWYDDYLKREEASADEIIRYSEILAKNNHISKGEPILKRYTEKYPEDHRLWSRYGYFTMWLGKKNIALNAFETALELRPFFKEALDGYDLVRGKGYVYTVNDTTSRFNYGLPVKNKYSGYPIDRYYRKVNTDPDDHSARKLLIEELVRKIRFEEAVEQLSILESSWGSEPDFISLKSEVIEKRKNYYDEQILQLRSKLTGESSDKEYVFRLGEIYAKNKQYDEALYLLKNHLQLYPENDDARYLYASILSWDGKFVESKDQISILLNNSPNNLKYNLLNGQLSSWMGEDFKNGENSLKLVLENDPHNYIALISLASINIQQNKIADAQSNINSAYAINPNGMEIKKLQFNLEQRTRLIQSNELYSILAEARENLTDKNCERSIELYLNYLKDKNANKDVKKELADAYLCNNNFRSAIKIYDELIFENPKEYNLLKQRAKLYFWSGNNDMAIAELESLLKQNPGDAEVKLLLADALFAKGNYLLARNIYEEMLVIAPTSHILQTRMKWLGSEGIETTYTTEFPTYMMLTPEAYYFTDNLDFNYSNYGMRYEVGVSNFLTMAIAGYGGMLSSDSLSENITILKASAFIKLNRFVSTNFTFGSTLFSSYSNSFLSEISFIASKKNKYTFAINFNTADAAQLLYSPILIPIRLRAYILSVQGDYKTKTDWIFSGSYSFLAVSDDNDGSKLQLRLGKIIDKRVAVGYEYYFFDMKDQTTLYWSPKNFESHSIWADWYIANSERLNATVGGKLGYIPSSDFVLREFYGSVLYKITQSFALSGKLSFGTTVQAEKGYRSTSFTVSAFWSL